MKENGMLIPTVEIIKLNVSLRLLASSVVGASKWENQVSNSQSRGLSTTLIPEEELEAAEPLMCLSTEFHGFQSLSLRQMPQRALLEERKSLGPKRRCGSKEGKPGDSRT